MRDDPKGDYIDAGLAPAIRNKGAEQEHQRLKEALEKRIFDQDLCECEPGDGGYDTVRCTFHRFADDLLDTLDPSKEVGG